MDKQQAFRDWYATEGVRTQVNQGMGFCAHEEYARVAFYAGVEKHKKHVCETIQRIHDEIHRGTQD